MRVIGLLVLAVVLIHPAGAADKQAAPSATVARRQKLASAFPVSAVHELAALEWAREAVPERRTEAQRQQLFAIVRQEWESFAREGLGEGILASGAQLTADDLQALLTQKAPENRTLDKARVGLTDLLEQKLQTDPRNADMDGDGINDSDDDFPQVSGHLKSLSLPSIWMNRAGDRAVVRWSARWTGGTLLYQLVDGKWQATETNRWIT